MGQMECCSLNVCEREGALSRGSCSEEQVGNVQHGRRFHLLGVAVVSLWLSAFDGVECAVVRSVLTYKKM